MTFEELKQKIIEANHVPAQVVELPTRSVQFQGDLDEYLAVIKQCGSSPVLIERIPFEEEAFLIEKPDAAEDSEMLDLRDLQPELRRFEEYVGQDCAFKVMACVAGGFNLELKLGEPWLEEYLEITGPIRQGLEDDAEITRKKREDAKREREQQILGQLNSLLDDPEFCYLKTQRAMKTYALEKIEGLAEADIDLAQHIAVLSDKIGMRKNKL